MLKLILTSLFLTALVGCDAPVRTRNGVYNTGSSAVQDPKDPDKANDLTDWNIDKSGSSSGGSSGSNSGFESCALDMLQYAYNIGNVGACKSSQDETQIKIKTSMSHSDSKLCVFPTYRDGAGASTYIGRPQCYNPQENVVVQGKLYKDRQGTFGNGIPFSQLPIKGLMIMKEGSIEYYRKCINGIAEFQDPKCPYGAYTSPYYVQGAYINCMSMANSFRTQICNDFKTTQPYIDMAF